MLVIVKSNTYDQQSDSEALRRNYHTSKKIKEKEEEWRQKNLEIFYLSTYSPQLNLIEILWKFMKYEWIEIDAYQCWDNLVNYVEKVIRQFGEEYVINFA